MCPRATTTRGKRRRSRKRVRMPQEKKWAKLMCSTCESVYVIDAGEVAPVVEVGEYLYREIACPRCGDVETAALRVLTLDAEEAAK